MWKLLFGLKIVVFRILSTEVKHIRKDAPFKSSMLFIFFVETFENKHFWPRVQNFWDYLWGKKFFFVLLFFHVHCIFF